MQNNDLSDGRATSNESDGIKEGVCWACPVHMFSPHIMHFLLSIFMNPSLFDNMRQTPLR